MESRVERLERIMKLLAEKNGLCNECESGFLVYSPFSSAAVASCGPLSKKCTWCNYEIYDKITNNQKPQVNKNENEKKDDDDIINNFCLFD